MSTHASWRWTASAVLPEERHPWDNRPALLASLRVEDLIKGTPGDDSLVGTAGDDTLNGREGADTMLGGAGNDFYVVDNAGDVVTELADEGIDTVKSSVSFTLGAYVENLRLAGSASLQGTGNELDNRLDGNAGDNLLGGLGGSDRLYGHGGNDSLDGGLGADLMAGGDGDDSYFVDDLADVVKEKAGAGLDTVYSSVDWTLSKGVENLDLTADLVDVDGYGNALDNLISDSYSDNYIDAGAGDDTILGGHHISFGSDTLVGGAGNDSIQGGGDRASDFLYGGLGNDTLASTTATMYGDEGDDVLNGGMGYGHHASGNTLYGGTGNDTLRSGGYVDGGDGDDVFETEITSVAIGGTGNDTFTGSGGHGYSSFLIDAGEGDDYIAETGYNNFTVSAGQGSDFISVYSIMGMTVDAGSGDDWVSASSGGGANCNVQGGEGNDTISAGGYHNTVSGGAGDDWLSGGRPGGDGTVQGDEGNDTLVATAGFDSLIGGSDADTFVLGVLQANYTNYTTVSDFGTGADLIGIDQSLLAVGNGDLVIDGATVIAGPGGFDAGAELVIVSQDVSGNLSFAAAAAAIGSANQAYTTGQTAVFAVGNGSETWLLYFRSSGDDAAVSAGELDVLAHLTNGAEPQVDDFFWGP
ncbi:calcium-binding protein [Ideonella sp. YS5]|uniref:calcium-binding protein n=1 Tax=Ideonella sp. YS5 TaxID=3453714 RepID=UPI003EF07108